MARIFISCGQRTEEERQLGTEIRDLVPQLTPFEPYLAEAQSTFEGLTANILRALYDASGFIAVMHDRGRVDIPGRPVRASVWIEQETAIAAFMAQILQRNLYVATYQQRGIELEGMREQLMLNSKVFEENSEVIEHLRTVLPTWTPQEKTSDQTDLAISIRYQKDSIRSERHEYALLVSVTNTSERVMAIDHVDVEMPTPVLLDAEPGYQHVVDRDTRDHTFFRNTQVGGIYPGDTIRVFQQRYYMDHFLYNRRGEIFSLPVRVTVYPRERAPMREEVPFAQLQIF